MKNKKINKITVYKIVTALSLFLSFTAFSLLGANSADPYVNYGSNQTVREASVFNGSGTYENHNPLSNSIDEDIYVIPLGTTFGIKLFTDGVIVASLTDIHSGDRTSCPAYEAGIKAGDYILSANGVKVTNNSSLAKLIGDCQGEPILFHVKRGDHIFETEVTPVFSDGSFKAGMWIRDSAAGIGTLTFYNPDTGIFGGLGHGICDMDTNGIMSLGHGEPAEITLCGIIKGQNNEPGQLQGYFTSDEALGELIENNETGVYGTLNTAPAGEKIQIAKKSDVQVGAAEILVSIDASGPQKYHVQIEKINSDENQRTKNMVIRITDEKLLNLTGGIVQGMSGCPVIQNGKLVGAVTHVFTEDPKTGYGIFAETMVEESVVSSMSKKNEF